MANQHFQWEDARITQLSERCTHIMLALMGLALMLMMMDLASPYLLIPAAAIIFITRQAQKHYNILETTFSEASIELSPRTVLINLPASDTSTRLRYKDIARIEAFRKWGVNGLRIQSQQGEQLELVGFAETLSAAILEAQHRNTTEQI